MPPDVPKPHPLLTEVADTTLLEDGDLELHYINGEMQVILRGVDVSDMISRVSWYWMHGMSPRASLDFGLSTLDVLSKTSTASFRRVEK